MLMRCKNVLDLAYSFLSTYSEKFQIHPLTTIRLFLGSYRDSSLGPFSPWHFKLSVHVYNPATDTLHIKSAVKRIFRW